MNDETLAARLGELPDEPLDGRVAAAVKRRARAALHEDRATKLGRAWTGVVLPTVLVGCALFYAYGSVHFIQQVYLAGN